MEVPERLVHGRSRAGANIRAPGGAAVHSRGCSSAMRAGGRLQRCAARGTRDPVSTDHDGAGLIARRGCGTQASATLLLCRAASRLAGSGLCRGLLFLLVVADHALDRADAEDRALLAADGDGDWTQCHGRAPVGLQCVECDCAPSATSWHDVARINGRCATPSPCATPAGTA